MEANQITLYSPTGYLMKARATVATGQVKRNVLGLFSNHKMHATRLLTDISASIKAKYPGLDIRFYEKPGAALVSPVELLARIKAECGYVLSAQGD